MEVAQPLVVMQQLIQVAEAAVVEAFPEEDFQAAQAVLALSSSVT
jgi:hypothetical protein